MTNGDAWLLKEIHRLVAAMPDTRWRPMRTAPDDGTVILVENIRLEQKLLARFVGGGWQERPYHSSDWWDGQAEDYARWQSVHPDWNQQAEEGSGG